MEMLKALFGFVVEEHAVCRSGGQKNHDSAGVLVRKVAESGILCKRRKHNLCLTGVSRFHAVTQPKSGNQTRP
jgi:hypothetical protein